MQLDKTRIAIRERSFPDLLDLALKVIRAHAPALALVWAAGALPCLLLNHWLLADVLSAVDLQYEAPVAYVFWMLVLLLWEAPLATAPMTLYLGQAMFVERPRLGRVAMDLLRSLAQLCWYQLLIRGGLVWLFLTWPLLLFVWPYLNEVILLERNPWRKRHAADISTFSRSGAMHAGLTGDLLARWLGSACVAALLVVALWLSARFLRWILAGNDQFDQTLYELWLPVAIWIVAGYFAVVRFLGYLDLRIRTEGWEIELAMRAEGARIARQLA